MHDIRAVRADPAGFDAAMARRGLPGVSAGLLAVDAERRAALAQAGEHQARRNALAKQVGQGKRSGADTSALEAEATGLRDQMAALERRAAELDAVLVSGHGGVAERAGLRRCRTAQRTRRRTWC